MTISTGNRFVKLGIAAGVVVAAAGVAYATSDGWWPPVRERLAALLGAQVESGDDGHEAGHDDGHDQGHVELPPNVVAVSELARQSLGIEVGVLQRSDPERVIRVPGRIVEIPGATRVTVTAEMSGEVTEIHVMEGQVVEPGQPLFDIDLTHEEAVQIQVELLDALARLDVVNREIARLQRLYDETSGGIERRRITEQEYERSRIEQTVESRRRALELIGLPREHIDALIEAYAGGSAGSAASLEERSHFITEVTVYAPGPVPDSPGIAATRIVEQLGVRLGDHVDTGDLLCELGDYSRLYVEGQAFERDLAMVRRSMSRQWGVTVVVEHGGTAEARLLPEVGLPGDDGAVEGLPILFLGTSIDGESRSAAFYVDLPNQGRQFEVQGRPFLDWRFRPGQRVEVRVPVEQFDDVLAVPPAAVAQDGLEYYVFQASGDHFIRREVAIRYGDEQRVVLDESSHVFEGDRIAMTGAYQLQLALQNRSSGPVTHSHGGVAHSH